MRTAHMLCQVARKNPGEGGEILESNAFWDETYGESPPLFRPPALLRPAPPLLFNSGLQATVCRG